jgi:flavin reductase (DIM6/NTAB) family NADH-FMN oxidoreductase RutF
MLAKPYTQAIDEGDPAADMRAFRRCLGQFATGVTIITTETGDVRAGVTANSFSSLSLDPPLVLWSIARTSRSCATFEKASHFTINVLAADQIEVSQRFSSAETDKFVGVEWERGVGGSPVLPGAVAVLECSRETVYEGGDHIILVGRVLRYARYPGKVLLYAQGQYGVTEEHPTVRKERGGTGEPAKTFRDGEAPLSTLLYFAHHYSSASFERHRREEGISLAQSRVISVLDEMPGIPFETLVSKIYLSELAAEDAVADLIQRACVLRDIAGRLHLTEAGGQLLNAIRKRVASYEAEQFSGSSQPDIEITRAVLSAFIARLKHNLEHG